MTNPLALIRAWFRHEQAMSPPAVHRRTERAPYLPEGIRNLS